MVDGWGELGSGAKTPLEHDFRRQETTAEDSIQTAADIGRNLWKCVPDQNAGVTENSPSVTCGVKIKGAQFV